MTNHPGPSVLVLILGRDPLPAAVFEAAQAWEAEGVAVSILSLTPRARLTPAAQQVTLLARPAGPGGIDPSTGGKPRSTARKVLRRLHLDPARWGAALLVVVSPRARRLTAQANVVLAADAASIPLGWVLARRGHHHVYRTSSAASRALSRLTPP